MSGARQDMKQAIRDLELNSNPISWDEFLSLLAEMGFGQVTIGDVKTALQEIIAEKAS